MKPIDGLLWRYALYIRPYFLLHENPFAAIVRTLNNIKLKHEASPICYIFADATNVGDRVSAKGISYMVGRPGVELFAAKAGLRTTSKTLKWLEKHRPQTKIIIGGGGLLQECFVPFWSELLQTNLPFILFGVGVNEMDGKRNIPPVEIMRALAQRACAIHVRDTWSQQLLQYNQARPVTVGVCPSVNYLVSKYRTTKQSNPARYLLHVMHPVDVRLAGGDPDMHRQKIKVVADKLGLVYDESDHIKEDLAALVQRYKRASLVISSRLHGCIFSFAFGIPFVPIVTDKKTAAFVATHIPENPTMEIDFEIGEIVEKIYCAEKAKNYTADRLSTALKSNVLMMDRILVDLQGGITHGD